MTSRPPFDRPNNPSSHAGDNRTGDGELHNSFDMWAHARLGSMAPPPAGATIRNVLSRTKETLAENDIAEPALESILLLTCALNISRVQMYLDFDKLLSPAQSDWFLKLLERRLKGEPSAYLLGHREFYGKDFIVDSNVLIPRPETELLVEKALELAKSGSISTIADIGTGSGAIAISLALKLPQTKIYATDISAATLKVAAANCRKHAVTERVTLLEGDLLEPLSEPVDLIVANLPYVTEADLPKVNTLGFEPTLALDGGKDGLDKIRRLCAQLNSKLNLQGNLLLEIGQGQRQAVTALLHDIFPTSKVESFADLAGIARMVRLNL